MSALKVVETLMSNVLKAKWDFRVGRVVPTTVDVALAGGAVEVDATILYTDLAESSSLVNTIDRRVAAKVMKAFLAGACATIRINKGSVVSFDGDRVMAVFMGDGQQSRAARVALKINYAVKSVLSPMLADQFIGLQESAFQLTHCTGVDSGTLIAVKAGVRGANDLIWVGRPANLAASLSKLRDGYPSYVTEAVYRRLDDDAKLGGVEKKPMWERATWKWKEEDVVLYRSKWTYVT